MSRPRSTPELLRAALAVLGVDVVEHELDRRRYTQTLELRGPGSPASFLAEGETYGPLADVVVSWRDVVELERVGDVEVWAEDPDLRDRIAQAIEPVVAGAT